MCNEKTKKNTSHSEYLSERTMYVHILNGQSTLFDNSILTISSFAIGIGFLLIKDLKYQNCMYLIWASLFLFVICIVLVIISFRVSHSMYLRRIENLDREQTNKPQIPESNYTRKLNHAFVLIFIVAIFLEVSFVFVNVGATVEQNSKSVKIEEFHKVEGNNLERGLESIPRPVPNLTSEGLELVNRPVPQSAVQITEPPPPAPPPISGEQSNTTTNEPK